MYVWQSERKGWLEEDCVFAINELKNGAGLCATAANTRFAGIEGETFLCEFCRK